VIRHALEAHAQKKHPGKPLRAGEHCGETYSIHEAETSSTAFVSNDDGARHVAGCRGVSHESFVDVARRLARCQRDVKPKQLVNELLRLARIGLDVGDRVPSVLDF